HWAVITSSSQSGAAPRWTRRSPRPATKAARMQRSRRSGRGVTIANVPGSRLSAPAPVSSSTPSRRRRSGGALLGAAAFFAVAGAIAYRAVEWTRVYGHPWSRWAFCDFRTVVYYPAVAFLAGDNPYDAAAFTRTYPAPFEFPPYSPLTILLHLPFALLPVGAAPWRPRRNRAAHLRRGDARALEPPRPGEPDWRAGGRDGHRRLLHGALV